MKKLILVLILLISIVSQSFSIISKHARAESKSLNNSNLISQNIINTGTKNQTCKCNKNSNQLATSALPSSQLTSISAIGGEGILDQIIEKVDADYVSGNSIYSSEDFEMTEAFMGIYPGAAGIFIPLKENPNSNVEKKILMFGYNTTTQQLGDYVIMDFTRANEETTAFNMTVKTLANDNITAFNVDQDSMATTFIYGGDVEATGYWERVQNCVKNNWKYIPTWAKWACSSACGGCLFASPYACGACIGCVGGYLIGCLAKS